MSAIKHHGHVWGYDGDCERCGCNFNDPSTRVDPCPGPQAVSLFDKTEAGDKLREQHADERLTEYEKRVGADNRWRFTPPALMAEHMNLTAYTELPDDVKRKFWNLPPLDETYSERLARVLGSDNVNSPTHYTTGGIECFDAMQAMLTREEMIGYLRGNSFKYRWRFRHKGGAEDLRKAEWYEKKLLEIVDNSA